VTVGHNLGDEIIDAAIVNDVFCSELDAAPSHPEGGIDFYRLRYLRLVGEYADASVKTHPLEGDDIQRFVTAATHRVPLADFE
jgi:hypothetical protein